MTKLQESTRGLNATTGCEQRASLGDRAPRMERVDRLRQVIANGTYRISSADIAEKIVSHMLAHRPKIH